MHDEHDVQDQRTEWFYFFQSNDTFGPFTLEGLKSELGSGRMNLDAWVCRAGEDDWRSIEEHPILRSELAKIISFKKELESLARSLNTLLILPPATRDRVIDILSGLIVYYRLNEDRLGPISLWQVVDQIDAQMLPITTEVCVVGSDYWRRAVTVACRAASAGI